jgi:hypothetical protein
MIKISKIILATLMFLCLLNMPYGYYEFVRFMSMVVFGILAYDAYKEDRNLELIILTSLALLFQPFFKIALGRDIWNVLDILVGLGLLLSVFIKNIRGLLR